MYVPLAVPVGTVTVPSGFKVGTVPPGTCGVAGVTTVIVTLPVGPVVTD